MTALVLLGLAVGKRSTRLDDWFHHFRHGPARWLLYFTDPWLLAAVLAAGIVVALSQRRWRLSVVMAVSPLVGIALAQVFKALLQRRAGDSLAFPSGHTTAAVVVMGMIVVLAGWAAWSVLAAVVVSALAALGQAVTYHYFTDTVGGVLLGTAVVCVAASIAELDTRQPRCDADHTSG